MPAVHVGPIILTPPSAVLLALQVMAEFQRFHAFHMQRLESRKEGTTSGDGGDGDDDDDDDDDDKATKQASSSSAASELVAAALFRGVPPVSGCIETFFAPMFTTTCMRGTFIQPSTLLLTRYPCVCVCVTVSLALCFRYSVEGYTTIKLTHTRRKLWRVSVQRAGRGWDWALKHMLPVHLYACVWVLVQLSVCVRIRAHTYVHTQTHTDGYVLPHSPPLSPFLTSQRLIPRHTLMWQEVQRLVGLVVSTVNLSKLNIERYLAVSLNAQCRCPGGEGVCVCVCVCVCA